MDGHDKALEEMGREPLEPYENVGPRRRGRRAGASYGTRAGGRPPKLKTLLIDGVLQDGAYRVVDINSDSIVIESVGAATMKKLSEEEEYEMAQQIAQLLDSDNPGDRLAASILIQEYDIDEVWIETLRIEARQRAEQKSE